jgi:hypothetical protein
VSDKDREDPPRSTPNPPKDSEKAARQLAAALAAAGPGALQDLLSDLHAGRADALLAALPAQLEADLPDGSALPQPEDAAGHAHAVAHLLEEDDPLSALLGAPSAVTLDALILHARPAELGARLTDQAGLLQWLTAASAKEALTLLTQLEPPSEVLEGLTRQSAWAGALCKHNPRDIARLLEHLGEHAAPLAAGVAATLADPDRLAAWPPGDVARYLRFIGKETAAPLVRALSAREDYLSLARKSGPSYLNRFLRLMPKPEAREWIGRLASHGSFLETLVHASHRPLLDLLKLAGPHGSALAGQLLCDNRFLIALSSWPSKPTGRLFRVAGPEQVGALLSRLESGTAPAVPSLVAAALAGAQDPQRGAQLLSSLLASQGWVESLTREPPAAVAAVLGWAPPTVRAGALRTLLEGGHYLPTLSITAPSEVVGFLKGLAPELREPLTEAITADAGFQRGLYATPVPQLVALAGYLGAERAGTLYSSVLGSESTPILRGATPAELDQLVDAVGRARLPGLTLLLMEPSTVTAPDRSAADLALLFRCAAPDQRDAMAANLWHDAPARDRLLGAFPQHLATLYGFFPAPRREALADLIASEAYYERLRTSYPRFVVELAKVVGEGAGPWMRRLLSDEHWMGVLRSSPPRDLIDLLHFVGRQDGFTLLNRILEGDEYWSSLRAQPMKAILRFIRFAGQRGRRIALLAAQDMDLHDTLQELPDADLDFLLSRLDHSDALTLRARLKR